MDERKEIRLLRSQAPHEIMVADRIPGPDWEIQVKALFIAAYGKPVSFFLSAGGILEAGFCVLEQGSQEFDWLAPSSAQVTTVGQTVWQMRHRGTVLREIGDQRSQFQNYRWTQIVKYAQTKTPLDFKASSPIFHIRLVKKGAQVSFWINDYTVLRRGDLPESDLATGAAIRFSGLEFYLFDAQAGPIDKELDEKLTAAQRPPLSWTAVRPDPAKPAGGFPVLKEARHHTIYRADKTLGTYCHHAVLSHIDGRFYAMWSNHQTHEDQSGQRVLYSTSTDGKTWSPAKVLFPSLSPMTEPPFKPGIVQVPSYCFLPFIQFEGTVYAVAMAHPIHNAPNFPPGQFCEARTLDSNGPAGPIVWLHGSAPYKSPEHLAMSEVSDPKLKRACDELCRRVQERNQMPPRMAADGTFVSHDEEFRHPDGRLMRLLRSYSGFRRLYVSCSSDERCTWTTPVPTNIPDIPAGTSAGVLPGGRIYLVGNQIAARLDDPQLNQTLRIPLTLAVSRDGVNFDRAWAIRSEPVTRRYDGYCKDPGFSYPSTCIVDDHLWVFYSANKEDMEITAVPLEAIR